jgi:hypothetical protein
MSLRGGAELMRRGDATLCDTPEWPGCQIVAAIGWICTREGRDVHMCRVCDKNWKEFAKGSPVLRVQCPNCSKELPEVAAPAPVIVYDMLGDYMAVAVERAMHHAGILEPVRKDVLKILRTDMSVWAEAEKVAPLSEEVRAGTDGSG